MRNITLTIILAVVSFFLMPNESKAICTGGNHAGNLVPNESWQTINVNTYTYYTFTPIYVGQTITFTFCQGGGSTSIDTQLEIHDNGGNPTGFYNDDFCGLGSEITFVAPTTNTYRISIYQFFCSTSSVSAGTLAYRTLPLPTEQDCLGALPLCNTYNSHSFSALGEGNYYDLHDFRATHGAGWPDNYNNCPNCMLDGELNSMWYTFTVQSAGQLMFTIVHPSNEIYDWSLHSLNNGTTCHDLSDYVNHPPVSCNWYGCVGSGTQTGMQASGTANCQHWPDHCTGNPFNAPIWVNEGEVFALHISSYIGGPGGYSIDFGNSTASIVNDYPPELVDIISEPSCGATSLTVQFSERLWCGGVDANSFVITGPQGTYDISHVWSAVCQASNANTTYTGTVYDDVWTIELSDFLEHDGEYTLTNINGSVTDICGNPNSPVSINFTIIGVTADVTPFPSGPCSGENNGSVIISNIEGGATPYSFSWTGPGGFTANTQNLSNIPAGTYTVTILDANGVCSYVETVDVYEAPPLTYSTDITQPSCGVLGSVLITPSGGIPPYDIQFGTSTQTGVLSYNFEDLSGGTYNIVITDDIGCEITGTVNLNIADNPDPTFTYNGNQCYDGHSFDFTHTGTVVPGETYLWTFQNGTPATSTDQNPTGITFPSHGNYNVTLQITAGGCIQSNNLSVNVYQHPTPTVSTTNENCGNCDGQAMTTSAYSSYTWSSGGDEQTETELCHGNYSVTVMDSNGCTGSASFSIGESGETPVIDVVNVTDASCFGDCNGSATVVLESGPGSVIYSYSGGSTPNNQTTGGLCEGTYQVTVSDATNANCYAVESFYVDEPDEVEISMSTTNSTCGLANGEVCVTVVAGEVAPITYLWSNSAISDCITVGAGNYSVTVTDGNTCETVGSASISDDGIPFSVNTTINNHVSCNGECDGSATVEAIGDGPFTYIWTSGETDATANDLCVGVNNVTVTEAGCEVVATVNISEPPVLTATISATVDANCGLSDGSITVIANGGSPDYTYEWDTDPVQTNATASGLATGTYSVTVTDNNLCTATASGFIDDIEGITAVNITKTDITCSGLTDGTATATVVGGTSDYTYEWSNSFVETTSSATSTATGLGLGNVSVVVTDAFGCTASNSITISEPNPISIVVNNTTLTTCYGDCDGTVDISVSGGTTPYSYSWSSGYNPNNSSNSNLCAGMHSVEITDGNDCVEIQTFEIQQPDQIQLDIAVNHENCGMANGSASANAIGGTPPYSYAWSHGGNTIGQTNTGLTAAGSPYNVVVTDANGCIQNGTATVYHIEGPIASISSFENVSCNGNADGSATVSVGGGEPPYIYEWNTTPPQANPTAINLAPGTYTVNVSDQMGCTTTAQIVITQPNAMDVNLIAPSIMCFGDCDGTIHANVTGGSIPYSAIWSNLQTGLTATNLCAGDYQVTITDDNSCTISSSISLEQGEEIFVTETITPSNCNQADGSIEISVFGGSEPYTFNWSNGNNTQNLYNVEAGTYVLTVTDNKDCEKIISFNLNDMNGPFASIASSQNTSCTGGCNGVATAQASGGTGSYSYTWSTTPVQTTATATNLCEGAYSVTVTDINTGCISTTSININEPEQLDVLSSKTDASCYGYCDASISLTPFNGTPPYSFVWSGPGVEINSQNQTNLCPGTYTVNILDDNNCLITREFTIEQPSFITVPLATESTDCMGACTGTASAAPIGGTPPYSYLWGDGQTTATAIALCSGSVSVTVSDFHGCTAENTTNINTPTQMHFTDVTINDVQCFGGMSGSISITITGGTPPYDYVWDNGFVISNPTNLQSGQHCVTVIDNNGCVIDTCLIINNPPALSINLNATDQACYNSCDGSITAQVTGGIAPYSFLWSNNEVVSTINNLCTGVYTVTVTDENGCQAYSSTSITTPQELGIVVQNIVNPTCGNSDGSISIGVTGGTFPYSYEWDTGTSTGNTISNISSGSYTVTVTDAHNCIALLTVDLDDLSAPIIDDIIVTHVDCYGNSSGSAEVFFTSSTPWNTIEWSDGQNTALAVNLSVGTYSVTITDDNGCQAVESIVITQPNTLVSSIANYNNVTCNGFCNGNATALVTGGMQPFTYSWSSGASSDFANNLCPGEHSLTVTDANGCQSISSLSISEPPPLSISGTAIHTSCYGGNDGMITVTASGGTGNYSYSWPQLGESSNVVTGLTASSYTIIVYDVSDYSCFISETYVVGEPAQIQAFFTTENSTCNLDNGIACVDVVFGGTGSYSYNWNPGGYTTECINNVAPGTYIITITDANNCEAVYDVSIDETMPLQIDNVIYHPVNCHGGNDGYGEVFASGGSPPYQYNWTPNVTDQSYSDELYAGIYNVQVVDQDNCAAYTSFPIGTPDPVVVFPNDGDTICIGQNATVAANAGGGHGPYTYYWTGLGTGASFIVSPNSTAEYTVFATDSRGCESEPDIVTIEVLPPLSLTVTTPSAVCQGQMSTLIANASGGDGNYVYDWGNGIVTTDNTMNISPDTTTTYTVILRDGCTTPADTASITASIAPMPEVHIVRNPHTGCAPLSVTFDNNTSNLTYSYSWDFDDPESGTNNYSNLKRPVHTFHESGQYNVNVIVTTNLGCKDSASVIVNIHEGPVADFVAHPWSTGLFEPEIEFTDASYDAIAWEWDFGDGTGSSEQSPTHVYFAQGEYPVKLLVYSKHACKDSIVKHVNIIDDMRIYFPTAINVRSPGNHEFYPKGVGIDVENYRMSIFNRWGEMIYTTRNYDDRWQGRYNNNKGDYVPQGVYTYVVTLRDKYGKDYTFSGHFTVFK